MNETCSTTVVIEAAFDVQSIKLKESKEKPETHSLDAKNLS